MSRYSSRGPEWEKTKAAVLERDAYLCQICRVAQATTVDHVIPKAHGGTDEEANLVAACRPCNSRKGSRLVTRATYHSARWFPGGAPS